MAVPFFVPEDSVESTQSSSSTATSPNVSTSIPSSPMPQPQPQQPTQPQGGSVTAPPTAPLMSPVNGEYLVQAFCEALYRYSRAGGSPGYPISPMTPLSPSCNSSGFNSAGYYGDVFFPQNVPRSPRFDLNVETPRSSRRMRRQSTSNARRSRLTSQGNDETDDEDVFNECFNDNDTFPSWYDLDDHYNSLAAREHLQEFSGRLPQPRKKRKDSETSPPPPQQQQQQQQQKEKPKDQKFGWPKYVALGVLAVGCGFFVSR